MSLVWSRCDTERAPVKIPKYVHHARIASRELDNPGDGVLHMMQYVNVRPTLHTELSWRSPALSPPAHTRRSWPCPLSVCSECVATRECERTSPCRPHWHTQLESACCWVLHWNAWSCQMVWQVLWQRSCYSSLLPTAISNKYGTRWYLSCLGSTPDRLSRTRSAWLEDRLPDAESPACDPSLTLRCRAEYRQHIVVCFHVDLRWMRLVKCRVRKVGCAGAPGCPSTDPWGTPGVADRLCRAGLADSYKLFTVWEIWSNPVLDLETFTSIGNY